MRIRTKQDISLTVIVPGLNEPDFYSMPNASRVR